MFSVFIYACNAILPIILLILLGYYLKRIGFFNDAFLSVGNKTVFNIALPALLFMNIYKLNDPGEINLSAMVYSFVAILVLFSIGLLITRLIADKRQKGVVLQCVFRSNFAIIGITVAQTLGGDHGAALTAVLSAAVVPVFNILAVIALTMYNHEGSKRPPLSSILLKIVKNPLIISVLLGLLCLAIRSLMPLRADGEAAFLLSRDLPFVYKSIKYLADIASPLALLVLGGQFVFSAAKKLLRQIMIGTLGRVVLAPLLGIGAAYVLTRLGVVSFGTAEFTAFIALFGTPVAISSAIMAAQMGADEQLAGQFVVWTSLCSMFTLFIIVFILRLSGII